MKNLRKSTKIPAGSNASARERGESLLNQMLGADRAASTRKAWRTLSPDFERYVVEFLSGQIWSRPGLELKIKSLCTVTALAALGRSKALELNIRMALRNGATAIEITEALLQIAPYAGFPACWEGLSVLELVVGEDGARGKGSGETA